MEIQKIINYIVDNVKHTNEAFAEHGLPYDPQIIARATYKELKSMDPTVEETDFYQAIEKMHDDGLAVTKANGLIYFTEKILSAQLAEA
jgi:hypothetical protein